MITEREVQVTVSSCVVTAGYLEAPDAVTRAVALGQIHDAAARVGGCGLSFPEVRRRILRPVHAGLVAEHGPVAGRLLHRRFLAAFEA